MKKVLAVAAFALASLSGAQAQTAPKPVPITISPDELASMMNYLNGLPYGQAAPIVQFFGQHEAAAQAKADEAAKAKDSKPAEKK